MYQLLRNHAHGERIAEWKQHGQKLILSVPEVISVSKQFLKEEGKAISSAEIERLLKDKRIEKESELGYAGKVLDKPTPQTRRNYHTAFVSKQKIVRTPP